MKLGYNKLNITPKKPVHIAGYNRKDLSQGVLDPIEINTIVLTHDAHPIVISILDSIIIEDSVIMPVKQAINKQFAIPFKDIVIGCIHTHSAPAYFKPFFENVVISPALQEDLIQSFINSISEAMTKSETAEITIKKTTIAGLYGNRNTLDGYSNKDIYIIDFLNSYSKKPIMSLINIACHPTILNGSNLLLSADLLGWVRNKYQETYHTPCMIVNGCCGDVSTRFYRKLSGIPELERVSSGIMEQLKTTETLDVSISRLTSSMVSKDYSYDGTQDEFVQNEIINLKKEIALAANPEVLKYKQLLLHNLEFKASKGKMTLNLRSHIIILGNFIIITLPGDITAYFDKMIKEALKGYIVLIIGYSENYSNYFVSKKDYGKYFETYITRLSKGNADDFIQLVINNTLSLLK